MEVPAPTSADRRPSPLDREAEVLYRRAEEIAARLSIPHSRVHRRGRRGGTAMVSAPFDDGGDEIDLDRTFEQLIDPRPLDTSRVIVRRRRRQRRALALLLDVSGSMRGERVKAGIAAVCALGAEFAGEQLMVVAFWSDASVLLEFGSPIDVPRLLRNLLALPGEGLTNLSFPMELAARALGGWPGYEQRALLLSDCVHNAGEDPRAWAARLPRLDVLLDVSGETDRELGRDLAREGRGRPARIGSYRDVPLAINAVFAPG